MHRIPDEEWPRYFAEPMQQLPKDAEPLFDFWPYVERIPAEDYKGFDCSLGQVDYAYSNPTCKYVHVLINSDKRNVFMVIVLDREGRSVVGHRLLHLGELYGLRQEPRQSLP